MRQPGWVLWASWVALGCTSGAQLAIDRAAREYDECAPSQFEATWISSASNGYEIYKVEGCGKVATYACSEIESACIKESDDR